MAFLMAHFLWSVSQSIFPCFYYFSHCLISNVWAGQHFYVYSKASLKSKPRGVTVIVYPWMNVSYLKSNYTISLKLQSKAHGLRNRKNLLASREKKFRSHEWRKLPRVCCRCYRQRFCLASTSHIYVHCWRAYVFSSVHTIIAVLVLI